MGSVKLRASMTPSPRKKMRPTPDLVDAAKCAGSSWEVALRFNTGLIHF